MEEMLTIRPWQNLYIHVPFCQGKCDYCAFYSEASSKELMLPYAERLIEQLQAEKDFSQVHTVYFGGGTPTLLPPEILEKLFSAVQNRIPHIAEFSVECNPETLDPARAEVLGRYVNRVSLGIQTFQPDLRRMIGRRGDPEKVIPAIDLLKQNGIQNIGCDLIYAIPGQTDEQWEDDLSRALALGLTHLSAYSLIMEEGTPLSKRCPVDPEAENRAAELELITRTITEKNGMIRYEISNYSKDGYACMHNRNIWYGETYLGVGPAACSFDGRDRRTQISDLLRWLDGVSAEEDRIPDQKRLAEIFIMGLRTVQGWERGRFEAVTGYDPQLLWNAEIADLRQQKMMHPDHLSLTSYGLDFWNDAAEIFFDD